MKLRDFERVARATAVYPRAGTGLATAVNYTIVGLAGEAGEVASAWKQALRLDIDDGHELPASPQESLFQELGDVLWYLVRACAELGLDVDYVASYCEAKLFRRYSRIASDRLETHKVRQRAAGVLNDLSQLRYQRSKIGGSE